MKSFDDGDQLYCKSEYAYEIDFNIDYQDKKIFSRKGNLKINGRSIETPALWLGHVIGGLPRPWEVFPMKKLIVNAHDILKRPTICEEICKKGIHKYLNFDGLVLMDSGGFLFQKKEKIDIEPSNILELYEKSKPDIGVVLDHPLDPLQSNKLNKQRWEDTLKNTEYMINNNSKINLMPVLHGYHLRDLKKACMDIKKLDENPQLIGLGSLVPLMFRTKGANKFNNCLHFVMDAIQLLRKEFPNSLLHAFGIGSTKSMHLMYALGVDSLDSTGWRIKAAYGVIQLPGVGDRYAKPRNNGRPSLNYNEKKLLEKCECPVCNDKQLDERMDILDDNFKSRALHNAWVFTEEQKTFRNHLINGNADIFVKKRLEKGHFSKAYSYITESRGIESFERWY